MPRAAPVLWCLAMLVLFSAAVRPSGALAWDAPAPPDTVPAATNPDGSPAEGDFLPSERFDDCVGLVQRPNCGSSERSDWRQGAALGALVVGVAVIGWRIIRAVRR